MTCPFIQFCNCRIDVDDFVTHCLGMKFTGVNLMRCEKIEEIIKCIHSLVEDGVMNKYHTPRTWYTMFVAMVVDVHTLL